MAKLIEHAGYVPEANQRVEKRPEETIGSHHIFSLLNDIYQQGVNGKLGINLGYRVDGNYEDEFGNKLKFYIAYHDTGEPIKINLTVNESILENNTLNVHTTFVREKQDSTIFTYISICDPKRDATLSPVNCFEIKEAPKKSKKLIFKQTHAVPNSSKYDYRSFNNYGVSIGDRKEFEYMMRNAYLESALFPAAITRAYNISYNLLGKNNLPKLLHSDL